MSLFWGLRAILLAGLMGCAAPPLPPAEADGTVIYPPAAGTAVLSADLDTEQDIARASVAADGRYRLTLPSPPPHLGTPAARLAQQYPASVQGVQCQGGVTLAPAATRLLLVRAGRFLLGEQLTGRLSPATSAVTLQARPLNVVLTVRQFVYADRAATLRAAQTCTFTLVGGQVQPGTVQGTLTLARGWNTLITRTEQTDAGLTITLSANAALHGVDWHYLPLTR
ncbi:hypothetical protein [Deinococcus multiflagellatus]|uniref:hypothetical protein n=1 Tax=Deinococcus multiflagellatus TaxID=1656887 RepID=UPI001CC91237|nr:hypothetical protein [Deinococcus multiflagellatus]MBZ9714574.1 hypothetical protein [Deinococcus multiflagellatus]